MSEILQASIPAAQRAAALAPLPRMQPVAGNWLSVDDAYAAQIGEKQRLLAARRDAVLWQDAQAAGAVAELVAVVLAEVAGHPAFAVAGNAVMTPDGRQVKVEGLSDLGAVVQEDLCLLERRDENWVLTAALLCFPASWTLAEKAGRPMRRIHAPVAPYDEGVAMRVDRLFAGVQPGRPLWRANCLGYADAALHQPRSEAAPRQDAVARYDRSERQTILRLPESGAVAFAIHTSVVLRNPAR